MSDPYASSKRPIRYPLGRPLAVGAEIEDTELVQLQWPVQDENERINIVINLSLKEYAALASCVDVGRDIAFGESSDYFWWLWLRVLKSMTICDDVAECLVSSDNVINALQQTLIDNGIYTNQASNATTTIVENIFPLAERQTTEIQDEPVGCDKDVLWAGIRELVERLSDQAKTALENITAQADKFQRVSEFLDTIPIVGGAADALVKNVVDSAQDMLNLYNAYDSVNNRDTLACSIFEIVCLECRYPTYQELYEAVGSNAIGEFADLSILNVATALAGFITASSAAQSIAYHTMIAFELFVLYADSKFFQLWGRDAIGMMCALGEDLPSDDWELLCSGCEPAWCIELSGSDFTARVFMSQNLGQQSGNDWIPTDNDTGSNTYRRSLQVLTDTITANITQVEIHYTITKGTYHSPLEPSNSFALAEGIAPAGYQLNGDVTDGSNVAFYNGDWQVSNNKMEFVVTTSSSVGSAVFSGSASLSKVVLHGTGAKPNIGQDCP